MKILDIKAREILDSRGNPTIEVDLVTEQGLFRSAVPSGASTGIHEAHELRDNEERYNGKGVLNAIKNVEEIIKPALIGLDVENQEEIDSKMIKLDGTENKSKLGANAILGVSMSVCRAGAKAKDMPLYKYISELSGQEPCMPIPSFNVINGGNHAGNNLAIQEFMILPVGAKDFKTAVRIGTEVYHILKKEIKEKYGAAATSVGDEGGFAPNLENNKEALELIKSAIEKAGYTDIVKFGIDAAASEFYKDGKYDLDFKGEGKILSKNELIDFYKTMISEYNFFSVEDPFDQDDWETYSKFLEVTDIQVVGDDLLVTNPKRIQKAIDEKSVNALLLKINQIGSITESIKALKMAKNAGWNVMVSHRSGETEDSFIADFVVGTGAGQIKSGAPCRSERLAKYNQLLRISEDISEYYGKNL